MKALKDIPIIRGCKPGPRPTSGKKTKKSKTEKMSPELRERIYNAHRKGMTFAEIARRLKLPDYKVAAAYNREKDLRWDKRWKNPQKNGP